MKKNIPDLSKWLTLLSLILIVCSGCGVQNTGEENLTKMFSVAAEDGEECMIMLADTRVEAYENGGVKTAVLILEGQMPSGCGSLMMRIDPPTATKQILTYLIAASSSDEEPDQNPKPFSISMPLDDLVEGTYTVIINDQPVYTFTYLNK